MSNRRGRKTQPSRFLGTYTLPGGKSAIGDLRLKGSSTLLKLHSDEFLAGVETASCVKGTAYSGEHLTLIDCHSPGTGHTSSKDAPTRYHADVFPHYVAVGRRHLEPGEACISAIHFTTTDLTTLFYDFDAFSHVIDAKPIIDVVLQERRQVRPVEAGELPQVFYFTGKDCIAEVPTAIGKVSVHHRPRYSMGGPTGVFIKNRIVVSIEPEQPVAFHDSIDRMYQVGCFLSMAAGRIQGVDHVIGAALGNPFQTSSFTAFQRIHRGSEIGCSELHSSTSQPMSGGYHPWSKFNAHKWSNLNAHRQQSSHECQSHPAIHADLSALWPRQD